MSTLKKLSSEILKIKNTPTGAEHLDSVIAKFAQDEGAEIAFLPLSDEAVKNAEAFCGEALPDGYDHYLIVCDGGVQIYYTNEIFLFFVLCFSKKSF